MANKLKRGDEEIARKLINKMLEKYDYDYDHVMKNPQIDGKLWCSHLTWTQQESDEYKKWYFEFFKNNVTPKMSKKIIEHQWSWFYLMYGLRTKEEGEL